MVYLSWPLVQVYVVTISLARLSSSSGDKVPSKQRTRATTYFLAWIHCFQTAMYGDNFWSQRKIESKSAAKVLVDWDC
jgi:hypothetical protein